MQIARNCDFIHMFPGLGQKNRDYKYNIKYLWYHQFDPDPTRSLFNHPNTKFYQLYHYFNSLLLLFKSFDLIIDLIIKLWISNFFIYKFKIFIIIIILFFFFTNSRIQDEKLIIFKFIPKISYISHVWLFKFLYAYPK